MKRRVVEVDHWRHFIPNAPDLEFDVESGKSSFLDLEQEIMVQGAKDPNSFESPSVDLNVTPLQRGWRMVVIPITEPENGLVKNTINGFDYWVHEKFEGQDKFNYILTNGTQESNIGTITVNVAKGYRFELSIEHIKGDAFEIKVLDLYETDLPEPEYALFTWHLTYPAIRYNPDLDNRQEVYYNKKKLATYQIGARYASDGKTLFFVQQNPVRLLMNFSNDFACDGLPIGDTDVPYAANGDRGKLELTVTLYFGELLRSESMKFTQDAAFQFSERWWDSGNLTGVENANAADGDSLGDVTLSYKPSVDEFLARVDEADGAVSNDAANDLVVDAANVYGITDPQEMTVTMDSVSKNQPDMLGALNQMSADTTFNDLEVFAGGSTTTDVARLGEETSASTQTYSSMSPVESAIDNGVDQGIAEGMEGVDAGIESGTTAGVQQAVDEGLGDTTKTATDSAMTAAATASVDAAMSGIGDVAEQTADEAFDAAVEEALPTVEIDTAATAEATMATELPAMLEEPVNTATAAGIDAGVDSGIESGIESGVDVAVETAAQNAGASLLPDDAFNF